MVLYKVLTLKQIKTVKYDYFKNKLSFNYLKIKIKNLLFELYLYICTLKLFI